MTDYKCEEVLPYNHEADKTSQVEQMFDNIAGQYDPMNRMMSLFNDNGWRKAALNTLSRYEPQKMLDVATGTGDFAILGCQMLCPQQIIGIDLSEKMLAVGRKKVEEKNFSSVITLQQADSLHLPFASHTFDAVTVAFGVRNFANLEQGLGQMLQVLQPGGHLVILELSEPTHIPFSWGYRFYTRCIIPLFCRLMGSDPKAYQYLPQSIAACPQGAQMVALLQKVGFQSVSYRTFTMGTCSLYLAQAPTAEGNL